MKQLLLTTITAVLLVGCGEAQQSAPAPEAKPVEPVAEATKPEPPTQTSATIYSDKCRFLVEVPNMDQVWEWGVTGANTCEYSWMVRIKAGDKVYELGYSFFNPNSRKQKGTFKELLKVGQTNMWLHDGGGASYVEGVYVNANTEGEFLVLELDDKAWTERLFKERPETVSIQIGGSELNKSESEVRVQYFAEEATADLIRKHGGKTGEELKADGFEPNYSGNYTLTLLELDGGTVGQGKLTLSVELKPDGSFIGTPQGEEHDKAIGSWIVEGGLLVCEGSTKRREKIVIKFNKMTLKLISLSSRGREAPLDKMIPEGADGLYLKQSASLPESKPEAPTQNEAQRIRCVNNLKQIGIATLIYASDNQDRYPWQVPQSEGGTAEIAQPQSDTDALLDSDGKPIFDANAWRHFQALSNELSNPKVLRCPNDESRTQANTFQSTPPKGAGRNVIPFDKNSVSYWLRTDPEVDEARRNEVMVVCPHHDGQYNILFTDTSVQQAGWNRLAQYFKDITNPITIAPQ
jgi:hypothetical protein